MRVLAAPADLQYAGKLHDPQGGDAIMLVQQVREVMTVNQEMTDESSWIWPMSEQVGFPLRSEFANENHVVDYLDSVPDWSWQINTLSVSVAVL